MWTESLRFRGEVNGMWKTLWKTKTFSTDMFALRVTGKASFWPKCAQHAYQEKYRCDNHLCSTHKSIYSHASSCSFNCTSFCKKGIQPVEKAKISLTGAERGRFTSDCILDQQMRVYTGIPTVKQIQRRNTARKSRNFHHSGARDSAIWCHRGRLYGSSIARRAKEKGFRLHRYEEKLPLFRNVYQCNRYAFISSQSEN